jgi:hypothetical protein
MTPGDVVPHVLDFLDRHVLIGCGTGAAAFPVAS